MKRTQQLLTAEIKNNIPALYEQDGKGAECVFHLRLFHNSRNMSWLISEYNGGDLFFGLASINGNEWEWGYISKKELESLKMYIGDVPMNIQGVERDEYFTPKQMHEIKELDSFRVRMKYPNPYQEENSTVDTQEQDQFNKTKIGTTIAFSFLA